MANVNSVRRAEIGREKRARTRAQLVAAAGSLFARQAVESVTVDDVVKEAGVAKGTFYVHFEDLRALGAAVALDLVQSFDELLQPGRLAISEPELRMAFGCSCFIDKALSDPAWARVVARMATASPSGLEAARSRFLEDMRRFSKGVPQGGVPPELSLEIVSGMLLQLLSAFGEGRLSRRHREDALAAILRAIGLDAKQIKSVLGRLPPSKDAALALAPGKSPKPRRRTSAGKGG
ncbi:TetR/AcrR family transcriptional regulator [Bradyrhizobium commune]|uniref:TetR/AcrR family transcriptional regulator n=1 Tax=Bradyrhizobium commune TaxID=83627 RepID=A0A7S9GXH3_9BRAD|nr:TetR/AcrR family transcriptional regulator [Bradyrhizobium commune]QPF88660.1 TetR/AcrR family transcriptional regulator [Bradyrhizobium commune]